MFGSILHQLVPIINLRAGAPKLPTEDLAGYGRSAALAYTDPTQVLGYIGSREFRT